MPGAIVCWQKAASLDRSEDKEPMHDPVLLDFDELK
jgi:hypothetical protein